MRRFRLIKLKPHYIDTEVLGPMAEGVEFSDGTCAVKRFLAVGPLMEFFSNIDEMEFFHGFGGKTVIEWVDRANTGSAESLE